ncbi:MAG: hypothetical protein Q9162_000248 [Coniocarpon cinnabarinum]
MSSPRSRGLPHVQPRPRVRKSIASIPSSDLDQENATVEVIGSIKSNTISKKSRSKSMGPGGLDALKETSGNRRRSTASTFQPKSILKPSIPLSPIRAIPTRNSKQDDPIAKGPHASPVRPADHDQNEKVPETPGRTPQDSSVRDFQESQHNKGNDEADQDAETIERRRRKAEAQKHREARRKSMAGRRVSFAPEATLHTWDTQVFQDMTASSGSTDSTEAASSSPHVERPGTPPNQTEEETPTKSPEHQRDAHKKRRRRSSGISPMKFDKPDMIPQSPFSSSPAVGEGNNAARDVEPDNGSPSPRKHADFDLNEGTFESIAEPTQDDEDLDASLEEAARRAGTRTPNIDDSGEVSMQIAGDEVTAAFKPWVKRSMGAGSPHPGKVRNKKDQENVNILSRSEAADRGSPTPSHDSGEDMSMDMTQAMGSIMQSAPRAADLSTERYPKRRKSVAFPQTHPDIAIAAPQDSDEDMSMDMTQAMGSIIQRTQPTTNASSERYPKRRQDPLAPQDELTEDAAESDAEEADMSMDMTQAMGSIKRSAPPEVIEAPAERYPKRRKSVAFPQEQAHDDPGSDQDKSSFATDARSDKQPSDLADLDPTKVDENEDLSMEFTSVFGGFKKGSSPIKRKSLRQSISALNSTNRRFPASPGRTVVQKSPAKEDQQNSSNYSLGSPHSLTKEIQPQESPVGNTKAEDAPLPIVVKSPATPETEAADDDVEDGDMEMTEAVGSIQNKALSPTHETVSSDAAIKDSESFDGNDRQAQKDQEVGETLDAFRDKLSHILEDQLELTHKLDEDIIAAREARDAAYAATEAAQKQLEEPSNCSRTEIRELQARVDELANSTGWRFVAAQGTQLTVEFEKQLHLSFDSAAYLPVANARRKSHLSPALSLNFAPTAKNGSATSSEPSTTQRFFLQLVRAHLHSLTPTETSASSLLRVVASGWELAQLIENETKHLKRRCGITIEQIAGDEKMILDTTILLPASESKVKVTFAIVAAASGDMVDAGVGVATRVAYGREYEKAEMDTLMQRRVGKGVRDVDGRAGQWAGAAEVLRGWCAKRS